MLFSIIIIIILLLIFYLIRKKQTREMFYSSMKLNNSDSEIEKNPSLLLPTNDKISFIHPDDREDKEPTDIYKDSKIYAYHTTEGGYSFNKNEIEKNFKNELGKYLESSATGESENEGKKIKESDKISQFMVPILWQTINQMYNDVGGMRKTIDDIKIMLRSANVRMIEMNKDISGLTDGNIDKKRTEDFDFNDF